MKRGFYLALLIILILPLRARSSSKEGEEADRRLEILDVMKEEMMRNRGRLGFEDYPSPYFISYSLYDLDRKGVTARYGALYEKTQHRSRVFYVDVRVGDYRFDSSMDKESMFDLPEFESPYNFNAAPIEDDLPALKHRLWLITDAEYKGAVTRYLKKKGNRLTTLKEKEVDSFSKERVERYIGPDIPLDFDQERYGEIAKRVASIFRNYPLIFDGNVAIRGGKVTRYLVSTEGAEILTSKTLTSFSVYGVTRADDGMLLEDEIVHYSHTLSGLPSLEEMERSVKELAERLMRARGHEVLDPYTGPAILGAEVSGVLFHEALGHRLEGERQDDESQGQTFRGQLGKRVVPEFISVIDDPTLSSFNGIDLNGHYLFDDQGVRAEKVVLVDKGILKNFLMSRRPITDSYGSNGHGRGAPGMRPVSRMANLVASVHRSTRFDKLKKLLLKECRKRGKRFGLIIEDVAGGSTDTAAFFYQAFKGVPRRVFRVDVSTGEETPVRGIELVGTPLLALNKILYAGDESQVFNGYCGAESGLVPVSVIAPPLLLESIEVQRRGLEKVRLPLLSPPGLPQGKGGHKR